MLSRKNRLPRNIFDTVISGGRVIHGVNFSVRYVTGRENPEGRASVVISKKVAGTAVARNRFRRAAYEEIAKHLPGTGIHCIFFAKPGSIKITKEEIHKEIAGLVAKIKTAGRF